MRPTLKASNDDSYVIAGAKVGYTVQARLPQRFTVTSGQAFQQQNLYDQTVPITLTDQLNVAMAWSSASATTEIDDVRKRYIQPAAEALANKVDANAFNTLYSSVYSCVGTLGTTPSAVLTYLQGGVKLTDLSAPMSGRVAVLDQLAMATLASASSTLFNPSAAISENYRKGQFGRNQLGFDEWYQDQNRALHTSGTFTACSPTVNGASQTGSSLITQAWASGATTLKKGDTFTIAGVYSVNPLSYVSTGRLQQFVVTADISDTAGAATISISPSIITSGQLQTVNASPANSAAITVWSANPTSGVLATTVSPQSLLFHPDFATFVMADLVEPNGGAKTTFVRSKQWAISIRMVEQFQIQTDQNATRLDVLVGAAPLQPRMACRVVG